jgi:TRAP-type C4-dicarboxylate transport system permease small subunit
MVFQEFLRLLTGWLVGGAAMFGIPFMLVLIVDNVARRLARRRHLLSSLAVSLIGTGFAADIVYVWAAWPIQVNRGHFWSPALITISALYWLSISSLSFGSSRWNFEGP